VNIAVTGGMGSGKSFVAEKLAEILCAESVSADFICRKLLEPGQAAHEEMYKQFSKDFFFENGELNRRYLRKTIFTDALLRQKVDDLLHPLVREELLHRCKVTETKGVNLVIEVPLLFEKGWQRDFDTTLVVYADEETCIKRIIERDLVSTEEAKEGIACQMSLLEKCKLSDWVIDNSGSFSDTLKKLDELKKIICKQSFCGKTSRTMKKA
jgi:dephospho-CoA kinase